MTLSTKQYYEKRIAIMSDALLCGGFGLCDFSLCFAVFLSMIVEGKITRQNYT